MWSIGSTSDSHIRFGAKVTSADFDEAFGHVGVTAGDGTEFGHAVPDRCDWHPFGAVLPGRAGAPGLSGHLVHTGRWPETPVDFAGNTSRSSAPDRVAFR